MLVVSFIFNHELTAILDKLVSKQRYSPSNRKQPADERSMDGGGNTLWSQIPIDRGPPSASGQSPSVQIRETDSFCSEIGVEYLTIQFLRLGVLIMLLVYFEACHRLKEEFAVFVHR